MNPVFSMPLAAVLGPVSSPAAPDIRPIVPPQAYYVRSLDLFWIAAAIAALVVAALVLWLSRRRRKTALPAPVSPRELARRRLRELETLMDALDGRTFGVAVADVLRIYIGAQYQLQPERQTSQEFLAAIHGSRAFSPVEHALLSEFLETCDLLKFARANATAEDKRRLLGQAGNFLDDSAEPPIEPAAAQNLTLGA